LSCEQSRGKRSTSREISVVFWIAEGLDNRTSFLLWGMDTGKISEVATLQGGTGEHCEVVNAEWEILFPWVKDAVGERLQPSFLYELSKRASHRIHDRLPRH